MTKGLIISGEFDDICVREKAGQKLELGELLIAENEDVKTLLQVFTLAYGSQLAQQNLELISGLKLEEDSSLSITDAKLRMYVLGHLKALLEITGNNARTPKRLPAFFSGVRSILPADFDFLQPPENGLQLGILRSGSRTLDVPLFINGKKMLEHHVLITGTTGRGKSVLMKYLLWNLAHAEYAGLLVLDPHDEYYGRTCKGLKNHPNTTKIIYYTNNQPPPGAVSLRINLSLLHPAHFHGVTDWSDAQREAISAYHTQFRTGWIEAVIKELPLKNQKFGEGTLAVLKRRLLQLLSLDITEETIESKELFTTTGGESTIADILRHLHNGKIVIIDTKHINGAQELLVGSIITTELFNTNKKIPANILETMPQTSIVLEEAPRVLGKDVLEKGTNIFGTIAREGRKFHVGLIAITQLPSLMPREVLANMNTKIILGTELKQERQAITESAAQDLSAHDRMIAALDKGEAIITSTFTKFATPISIPNFETIAKQKQTTTSFDGVKT
ncbi:MAG: ATP-binding protein [Candidatus Aenigmarchaeota archaeon]|nr:ATP-binding protein [Candidatus Aenigmarchaeota archaeon]